MCSCIYMYLHVYGLLSGHNLSVYYLCVLVHAGMHENPETTWLSLNAAIYRAVELAIFPNVPFFIMARSFVLRIRRLMESKLLLIPIQWGGEKITPWL